MNTYVEPLQVDPVLWAAFADLRTETVTILCAGTCGRELTARKSPSISGYPREDRQGRCTPCYTRHLNNGGSVRPASIRTGTPCQGCGRPLRIKRTRAADAPGTVRQYTPGKCEPCTKKDTR